MIGYILFALFILWIVEDKLDTDFAINEHLRRLENDR